MTTVLVLVVVSSIYNSKERRDTDTWELEEAGVTFLQCFWLVFAKTVDVLADRCTYEWFSRVFTQVGQAYPQLKGKDITFGYKIIYKDFVSSMRGYYLRPMIGHLGPQIPCLLVP